MSNSQDRKGSLARLLNMHTRGPTLNTGEAIWQDIRMFTQELQFSPRDRHLSKTFEYEHKRSNSHHGIGNFARHPNVHTRGPTLNTL
ncbi:hypothetical protein PoB_002416000 [Plakobranchus ocellatus]|uniref:Uncharacterized protein n=1 Tax=Plakobranchus ocellatus TaxID=259542 RepID=A0AAV3ZPK4_9GAST|nr:hypothetical protein PoB_002416000 [Plakobranchus ocellatus]